MRHETRHLDPQRIYPALVFIPLFYILVRYLPPAAFFVVITGVALLAFIEFYRLFFPSPSPQAGMAIGLGSIVLLMSSMQWPEMRALDTLLVLVLGIILIYQLTSSPQDTMRLPAPILLFGIIYIGLMLGFFLLTRQLPNGEFFIFYMVLVTWVGDTAAYYVGKLWGSRPLAPTLSPKKTIEGFIGGLTFAPLAAWLAHLWFLPQLTTWDCLATGLLLTGAGLLGDLSESAFKRASGVKDSGSIIPGHGGVLDRVDSLLFTAPIFYYYLLLVKGMAPPSP